LVLFALADVALAVHAIRHTSGEPQAKVALQQSTPTPEASASPTPVPTAAELPSALTLTPGQPPVVVSSYGRCSDGRVDLAKAESAGITRISAITGTTGTAASLAEDKKCRPGLWLQSDAGWKVRADVTVPAGPSAATTTNLWIIGQPAGAVLSDDGKVVSRPKNPCGGATPTPTHIAAISKTKATVVCSAKATALGQVRLVYGTTDGGKSWAEFAGARAVGPSAKGRKDGLDGDGEMAAFAALGDSGTLGTLLRDVPACPGLQFRTSRDSGRNWTVGGCLELPLERTPLALGGGTSQITVAGVTDAGPVSYVSADGGKSWATT
jgi:hypothetical protein